MGQWDKIAGLFLEKYLHLNLIVWVMGGRRKLIVAVANKDKAFLLLPATFMGCKVKIV
jgi:hypothetical protein